MCPGETPQRSSISKISVGHFLFLMVLMNHVDKKIMGILKKKNYFPFFFCICLTMRACMPKYCETPMAWHWSMDALSNETMSEE